MITQGSAHVDTGSLPILLTVPQAAKVLGIGRTLAYELVRTDAWPTPVIRAARLIKISSRPLVELITGPNPPITGARTWR